MALVLTKSNQSAQQVSVPGYSTNIVVPVSTNQAIDSTNKVSTKWVVTMSDVGNTKAQAFEVLAVQRASGADHSIYGQVGDAINFNIDVSSSGGIMSITVTNNDAFDLHINITHIGL